MQKLVLKYRAEPTALNAAKLVAYDHKHPMAACMMCDEDIATLKAARRH